MMQFALPPAPLHQSMRPAGATLHDLLDHTAARTDGSVGTLRTYYGWLDGMRLVERGQDLVAGLMK